MPATAETSSSKHIKKHKKIILRSPGFGQAWPVGSPSSQATPVCPGMARSFQCKIWPPPMEVTLIEKFQMGAVCNRPLMHIPLRSANPAAHPRRDGRCR